MAVWDADGSGSVGVAELEQAAEAQKRMSAENRLVKKLLFAAVVIIVILCVSTLVLSMAANEATKDMRPVNKEDARRRRLNLPPLSRSGSWARPVLEFVGAPQALIEFTGTRRLSDEGDAPIVLDSGSLS